MVYEELEIDKKYIFAAIRHALSHPRRTQRVKDAIKEVFGEDQIDIDKRRHTRILREHQEELASICEQLLVKQIFSQLKPDTPRIGNFYII